MVPITDDFRYVKDFGDIGINDVALVGGKNASLGEIVGELVPFGVRVFGGFAIIADGFRVFIDTATLRPNLENLPRASFASQHNTFLNIHSVSQPLDAADKAGLARKVARQIAREPLFKALRSTRVALRKAVDEMDGRSGKLDSGFIRSGLNDPIVQRPATGLVRSMPVATGRAETI